MTNLRQTAQKWNTRKRYYCVIRQPIDYEDALLMWQNGRQLASYNKGNTSISYTYDVDGLRTSKTVNGVKHEYLYQGGNLVYEKRGDEQLYYYYDSYDHFSAIRRIANGANEIYYATTNAQGDVLGLYNDAGVQVVSYVYDAWGNVVSMTDSSAFNLGTLNPIRYRGYYFDEETGWYYLQSRYYDPEIGRFINADGFVSTGRGILGHNMYAYCNNNPVILQDVSGNFPWLIAAILVGCGILGGILGGCSEEKLWQLPFKDPPKPVDPPEQNTGAVIRPLNPEPLPQEEKEELTTGDRIANVAIGVGAGIGVGGLAVIAVVAYKVVALGSATTVIAGIGMTGKQGFAIGALAYNFFAYCIAPFLGIDVEGIEYD